MTRLILAAFLIAPAVLGGQSLAGRVASVDGRAEIVFPSRPDVCGNGRGNIDGLVGVRRISGDRSAPRSIDEVCVHGPVRVVAMIVHGEVTRLRTYIGPVPIVDGDVTRISDVSATQAREWLIGLAERGTTRVAVDAILPLLAADGLPVWPELVKIARDDDRPGEVRRQATFWLAAGASARIDQGHDDSDDDEVGKSAVFGLSQQPRSVAVPALIDAATNGKSASIKASALFWLGQSGDSRALPVFVKILGVAP